MKLWVRPMYVSVLNSILFISLQFRLESDLFLLTMTFVLVIFSAFCEIMRRKRREDFNKLKAKLEIKHLKGTKSIIQAELCVFEANLSNSVIMIVLFVIVSLFSFWERNMILGIACAVSAAMEYGNITYHKALERAQ